MTVGNVVALAQQNLKRMLAYSSIAHVGYMLVGVVAGGSLGNGSVLFYLLVYTFTTAGAFGAILLLERDGREAVELADYGGLATRHPVLAVALSVFLLSLVGIPPTAGFVGKFYLFGAAVQVGLRVAGRDRRAELRDRRLLLPAPHRLHVHARARGRARPCWPRRSPARSPWSSRSGAWCSSAWPPAPSSTWPRPPSPRSSGSAIASTHASKRPAPLPRGEGVGSSRVASRETAGRGLVALPVSRLALRPRRHRLPGRAPDPGRRRGHRGPARGGPPGRLPLQQAAPDARGLRGQAHAPGHARRRRRRDQLVAGARAPPARPRPRRAGVRDRRAADARGDARARLRGARRRARALGGHRLRPHLRLRQAQHRAPGGEAGRAAHRHQSRPHLPGGGRRDPGLRGDDRGGGGGDGPEGRDRSSASRRRSSSRSRWPRSGVPAARGGDRGRPHRDRHRDGQAPRAGHHAGAERHHAPGRPANRRGRSGPRATIHPRTWWSAARPRTGWRASTAPRWTPW